MLAFFREENPRLVAIEAEVTSVLAETRTASILPNPELSIRREDVSGDVESTDNYLEAAWPLDISGRRSLNKKAAAKTLNSTEQLALWEINSLTSDVRAAFYRLLWAQFYGQEMDEGVRRLTAIVKTVRSRGGARKDYDRTRLERELAEAEVGAQQFKGRVKSLQKSLASLLGSKWSDSRIKVTGQIFPEGTLPEKSTLENDLITDHPKIVAAVQEAEKARLQWSAAKRQWVPDLKLAGGYKGVESGGVKASGYTAGLAVEVPLFNRGQAATRKALARSELAESTAAVEKRETQILYEKAYEENTIAREAFVSYKNAVVPQAERLEQLAGLGYLEGRLAILELIDAYHGGTHTRLQMIDMALDARLSQIEIERVIGRPLNP